MYQGTLDRLRERQKNMHIPYEVIAKQSGLGIATVKRFFLGGNSSVSTLEKIASVLKCDIRMESKESGEYLFELQIEKKALQVVNRIMKTSALEQQEPNRKAYEKMLQKAKEHIRKMPKSQIWS